MFKKILIIFVIIIIAAIVFISKQPDDFYVTKTVTINAPAPIVFSYVNDFHQWKVWSPWVKPSANTRNRFTGAESGVGAIMNWEGRNEDESGSITITKSDFNQAIQMALEVTAPIAASNVMEFLFVQDGAKTTVTWNAYGQKDFFMKAISLIFDCNKTLGEEFDKGLSGLKIVVEQDINDGVEKEKEDKTKSY